MSVQTVVESCVQGLGYELVELDWRPGGQLCVYIEHSVAATAAVVVAPLSADIDGDGRAIKIEDCERVSHQLSHVLLVENIDYARLEVSSPGLDRPLKKRADFDRFVGADVSVKLRYAFDGRRIFEGRLNSEIDGRYSLDVLKSAVNADGSKKPVGKKSGVKPIKGKTNAASGDGAVASDSYRLSFALDEIERARLVPRLRF